MEERAAAEAAAVTAADDGVITSGSLRWAPSLKADLWAEGAKCRLPLSKHRREEIKSWRLRHMHLHVACELVSERGACVWLLFLIIFSPKTTTHLASLFYLLFGFSLYTPLPPNKSVFFFHLYFFFFYKEVTRTRCPVDSVQPSHTHALWLRRPSRCLVWGSWFTSWRRLNLGCMCRAASVGGT